MSLFSGFNVTLDEVKLMGEAAKAAFTAGAIPVGWSVVTPQQLGVPATFWDGNYFTDSSSGASAIVLRQGTTTIVSFRGTDGNADASHFQELFFGTYINHFQPLLSAVAANSAAGTNFFFTGASLGGGAVNQMADIASSQYGGLFAAAKFVAFASPNISNANGIVNIGAENDPVYKLINNYGNFASSLDHLVIASPQYMAGNYDGRHPFDTYAHVAGGLGLEQMPLSVFFDLMTPDSVVIFDAVINGLVQDVTPGRENTGAFYLGQAIDDQIAGRGGNDFIEGFGGNDTLTGGAGNDSIDGGDGTDSAVFSGLLANYTIVHGSNGAVQVSGPDGIDTVSRVEILQFNDQAVTLSTTSQTPPPTIVSNGGADTATVFVASNTTAVATVTASNSGAETAVRYSIVGGADQSLFQIDTITGALSFILSHDFAAPADSDANNSYVVEVRASDGSLLDSQLITVNVIEVNEIAGGNGSDLLYGGLGNDLGLGNAGDDVLVMGSGIDFAYGNTGNDYAYLGNGNDTAFGDAGVDVLLGEDGDDVLFGGDGQDYLFGGSGTNTMYGGADVDVLISGGISDLLSGGGDSDYFYAFGGGPVTAFGDDGNDIYVGSAGADTFYGGAGQDYFYGQGGNDVVYGGTGVDVLLGEAGNDFLYGGGGAADYYFGGAGGDVFAVQNLPGANVLQDFNRAEGDLIGLQSTGLASFGQVLANTSDFGGFCVVTIDSDTNIWIIGQTSATLQATDFAFT